jgi:hypothetical protein
MGNLVFWMGLGLGFGIGMEVGFGMEWNDGLFIWVASIDLGEVYHNHYNL